MPWRVRTSLWPTRDVHQYGDPNIRAPLHIPGFFASATHVAALIELIFGKRQTVSASIWMD